jgi:hypothetical protein
MPDDAGHSAGIRGGTYTRNCLHRLLDHSLLDHSALFDTFADANHASRRGNLVAAQLDTPACGTSHPQKILNGGRCSGTADQSSRDIVKPQHGFLPMHAIGAETV